MTLPVKALPWVASVGVHAVILLVPLGFLLSRSTGIGQGSGIGLEIAVSLPASGQVAGEGITAGTGGRLSVPRPTGAGPKATGTATAVSSVSPKGVLEAEGSSPVSATATLSAPSARDVLADLASIGAPIGAAAGTAAAGTSAEASAPAFGGQIAWEGTTRVLIRRREPQFPSVLSAAGQEVEGVARITVAPSGAVTRVEITRSSGYTEVDASVEAALRDYLFSRVDGRRDSVGTVAFRFRLEKLD